MMPEIGEVKYGREIGKYPTASFIWISCLDCNVLHWTKYIVRKGVPKSKYCSKCSLKHLHKKGKEAPNWQGGVWKAFGYARIYISPDSPFYEMGKKGNSNGHSDTRFILEHRLVMARYLGRCLKSCEVVHHINNIKNDNRIENLELISTSNHQLRTLYCNNCDLKKENNTKS